MQAIKVQIYFSEWEKVSDFISEINIDEEMAAYAIGKSSVSCPLKPSDSAPLKHSTMPP